MTELTTITGACLKCRHMTCKSDLLGAGAYCRKDYERPHIKDRAKYVGACDHLDYDDESVAKWDSRLAFCRAHAR
jgi:hypothetical protein